MEISLSTTKRGEFRVVVQGSADYVAEVLSDLAEAFRPETEEAAPVDGEYTEDADWDVYPASPSPAGPGTAGAPAWTDPGDACDCTFCTACGVGTEEKSRVLSPEHAKAILDVVGTDTSEALDARWDRRGPEGDGGIYAALTAISAGLALAPEDARVLLDAAKDPRLWEARCAYGRPIYAAVGALAELAR